MTFPSTGGRYRAAGGAPGLRRLGVAAIVVSAHVAFVLVLMAARGGRHSESGDIVEIAFFPLPITMEEARPRKETPPEPARSVEPRALPPRATASGASAPALSRAGSAQTEIPPTFQPDPPPSGAIDWQAELATAAGAMDERARADRERRSFSGPPPHASLTPRGATRPCPFEKCEPGWGAAPSIFDSTASKKGRIEKTPDGEVIRWMSNNCHQTLVSSIELHRGMIRCFKSLGKNEGRGDLFDSMRAVPLPEERGFDVP